MSLKPPNGNNLPIPPTYYVVYPADFDTSTDYVIPEGASLFQIDPARGLIFMGPDQGIVGTDHRAWFGDLIFDSQTGQLILNSVQYRTVGDPTDIGITRIPGEDQYREGPAGPTSIVGAAAAGAAVTLWAQYAEEMPNTIISGGTGPLRVGTNTSVRYTAKTRFSGKGSGAVSAGATTIVVAAKIKGILPEPGAAQLERQPFRYTGITRVLNTTLAVDAVPGDPTITLTDATNVVGSSGAVFVDFGDGERCAVRFASKAGNILTLVVPSPGNAQTGLTRTIAAGSAVVQDRFDGVTGITEASNDYSQYNMYRFTVTGLTDAVSIGDVFEWNPRGSISNIRGSAIGQMYWAAWKNGVSQDRFGGIYAKPNQDAIGHRTGGNVTLTSTSNGDDTYTSQRRDVITIGHNRRVGIVGGGATGPRDPDLVAFPLHVGGQLCRTTREYKFFVGDGITEVFADATDGFPSSGTLEIGTTQGANAVATYTGVEYGKFTGWTTTSPGFAEAGGYMWLHPNAKEVVVAAEGAVRANAKQTGEVTMGPYGPAGEAAIQFGVNGARGFLYPDATTGKLCFKDNGGVVHVLY